MTKIFYSVAVICLVLAFTAFLFGINYPDGNIWTGIFEGLLILVPGLLFFAVGNLWGRVNDLENEIKTLKNDKKDNNQQFCNL